MQTANKDELFYLKRICDLLIIIAIILLCMAHALSDDVGFGAVVGILLYIFIRWLIAWLNKTK